MSNTNNANNNVSDTTSEYSKTTNPIETIKQTPVKSMDNVKRDADKCMKRLTKCRNYIFDFEN